MKNNLLLMAVLLCGLLPLASCGSDSNDEPPTPAMTATTTYTLTFGADFFDAAKDVIVYYKGANNQTYRELITSGTQWKKTVTTSKFPADFGYKLDIQAREESELQKDSYDVTLSAAIATQTSTGVMYTRPTLGIITTSPTSKAKVLGLLSLKHSHSTYGYRMSENGSVQDPVDIEFN